MIDNTIRQFPKVEEGLRNIEQGETSLSDSLDALRKKLTEARLKEAQTLSNVFIVDSARLPLKSNYPAKADLALLSLALGLVLGVLAVVLRWKLQLDRRLKHGLRLVLRSLEPRRAEADEKATRADDAPESFDQALDDIFAPRSTMGDRLPHSASALTQADLATVSPQVLRQRLSELTHDYVARLSRFEAQSQVLAKQVVMLRQHEQQADGADSAASRTPMTGQRQKIQQSAADLKRERQALERRATMIRRLEAFLATPSPRKPAGSAEEIKRRLLKRYMMQRSASLQSSAATPQAS